MKISTMRFIDRFVGTPACWLSGIIQKVLNRRAPESIESILVIKFFGLGSILLTSPTLRSVREHFPKSNIIFLTFSSNSELLDEIPFIDERWLIDPRTFLSFLESLILLAARLMVRKVDVVLDLEFFSKFSTLIGALAHPGRHIGFALPTRWRTWNVTDSIPLNIHQHVTKTFHDALAPLGIKESGLLTPRIQAKGAEPFSLLGSLKVRPGAEIICINPNAGKTSLDRRWSSERFSQTIDILQGGFPNAVFCLIGARDEREYIEGVIRLTNATSDRIANLGGSLTLKGLIGLFSHSKLLITNDSGPMHIAASVGLPTVALFGPESPVFYSPVGNRTINLYAGLPCSPCLNVYDAKIFRCPINVKCLKEISVDRVVASAKILLSEQLESVQLEEVAA
ncbi:MAG: glycosyltransferase family 9 protein [Bacteroidota bacterium]